MARRRSDKALGRDPLDALDDIEWIIREETVADSSADVAPERAIAEDEPSTDDVAAESEQAAHPTEEPYPTLPADEGDEEQGVEDEEAAAVLDEEVGHLLDGMIAATDAADHAVCALPEGEPALKAEGSQVAEPTDKPALAPTADQGDAEDDQGGGEAGAEPDGVPSEWPFEEDGVPSGWPFEDDGVPSEWPSEEDGVPSERPCEDDGEVCHLLDEMIAAIDQDVEQTLRPEAVADLAAAAPARPEDEEQYVIFALSGAEYAVPITNVIEIGRPLNVTPVPNVPDWVVGVANLRGDIISMVDLRAFLGMERTGYGHASRMLVAQAHQGQLTTGLIVDRVSGIWYLPMGQIGAPAAPIEDQVTPYLRGVYEHDGRLLVVLDLDRLLLSPEMRQFEPV